MRQRIWLIISAGLLIAGAIGFLYPAFIEGSEHKTITDIVVSLLRPDWTQQFAMRWVFVGVMVCSVYVYVIDKLYRRNPVTVIRTEISVDFKDASGVKVETSSIQLLRANRPGVSAYYSSHRPSSEKGRVPREGIGHSIHCDMCNIKDDVELYGNEGSGFDVLHMFNPPLPYSWYMPFIPIALTNKEYKDLPRFLQKNIVVRRAKVLWIDEHSGENPDISFSAAKYSQMNVSFVMNFFSFVPKELRVRRIQNTGVIDINCETDLDRKVAVFRVHRLVDERILITWKQ